MKRMLILCIRFYQRFLSPLKPPCCRFHPSCSTYAIQALQHHGLFKGTALTVWRVLRCNPFGGSGYDPVPGCEYDPDVQQQAEPEQQLQDQQKQQDQQRES